MTRETDETEAKYRAEQSRDVGCMDRRGDQAQADFPVQNTPPMLSPVFFHREAELNELRTHLRTSAYSRSATTVVLGGVGGVGKTALALKLFRELCTEEVFDAIFWINGESKDTMVVSFAEISGWIGLPRRTNDPEQNSMLGLAWLRTTSTLSNQMALAADKLDREKMAVDL